MADSMTLNDLRRVAQTIIENSFPASLEPETDEKLKNIARYLESVYAGDSCTHETLRTAHEKAMVMLDQYHQASKTALLLLEEAYKAVEQSKRVEQSLLGDLQFLHKQPSLPEDIRTNALGMLEKIQEALDRERSRGKDAMDSIQNELNQRMDYMKASLHGPGISKHLGRESSAHASVDTEENAETLPPTGDRCKQNAWQAQSSDY